MMESSYRSLLAQFQFRRNLWMVIALMLAVSNVGLTGWAVTRDAAEKTIVVPPSFERAFWVKGDAIAPEYLEQMGIWFANLALTYNPDNIDHQVRLFLRHADPHAHGALATQLHEDAEKVRRNRVASVFYPRGVKTRGMRVTLDGDLMTFVGTKQASVGRSSIEIDFAYRDSTLYVVRFQDMEDPDTQTPQEPAHDS